MAYNPNMYMPYQTGIPSPMYQPNSWMPTQSSTMQPVNGLVSVTGIEGAKAYQLPPNSSMPLFDQDNDILYLKTTDSAGYPTIKQFAFQPVESQNQAAPTQDYVPRSEFDALVEEVRQLVGKGEGDGK